MKSVETLNMNLSSVIGGICICLTMWIFVIDPSPRPELLLDWRGLGFVLGGTFGISLLIYPMSQLSNLFRFVLRGYLLKKGSPSQRIIAKEILAASALRSNESHLYPLCPTSHPFLKECFHFLADPLLSEMDLREILARRNYQFKVTYSNDAKVLSTLGKFPSSLGMMGSTVGLVDMMAGLGELGQAGIGNAMAMALATTFWGLVLTYLFFMPLSDYAVRMNAKDIQIRQLILEGVLMIKRREDPRVIVEKLNGFLALHDRLTLKQSNLPQDFWKEAIEETDQIRKKYVA